MSYNKTVWEDLPSTNTPLNASNLNKIENELEVLETNSTYSTSETPIGIWVDGKTLYRKVIDVGNLPNNTTKDVASGLSNVTVQRIYGRAYNSSTTNVLPLPYVAYSDAQISIAYNNNNIRVLTYADRSTWTGYVVLEYTKNS